MRMGQTTGRPIYWAEETWHEVLDQAPWPDQLDSSLPNDPLSDDELFEASLSYDTEPLNDHEPERQLSRIARAGHPELTGMDLIQR